MAVKDPFKDPFCGYRCKNCGCKVPPIEFKSWNFCPQVWEVQLICPKCEAHISDYTTGELS
jgi:hypothetical protein